MNYSPAKYYLVIIMLLIIKSFTFGQVFNDHHIITTGKVKTSAESIDAADFDNDGDLDIIAGSSGVIQFLENIGNQEFKTIRSLNVHLGYVPVEKVIAADVNNDGLVDIVYSFTESSCKMRWLKNIGDNDFMYMYTCLHSLQSNADSDDFMMPDLNGDSCPDLVIGSDELKVKISQCDGSFSPNFSLLDDGILVDFNCIDIDNDSDIDIVYTIRDPYEVAVYLNNGIGEFPEKVIVDTVFDIPYSRDLHIVDANNDNYSDIMSFMEKDSMVIFLNNSANNFSHLIVPIDSLFYPYSTLVYDFDNDGDDDLVDVLYNMLENTGNNSFVFRDGDDFPLYSYDRITVDLNENGVDDILFGLFNGAVGYIEDPSFNNITNWRVLTSQVMRPTSLAFEKINDDQYPDICLLDYRYRYVSWLNNGNGEFFDTINTDILHDYANESIFYDINHDGFCDIISYSESEYADLNDSTHFQIAGNNGDNTFTRIFIDQFDHFQYKEAGFIDYDNNNCLNVVFADNLSNCDTIYFLDVNPDFTITLLDTIVYDIPHSITNYKFHDINNNGQNDFITSKGSFLFVNYSNNNRFENELDTILISDDQIIDFEIVNITNDSVYDFVYSANDKLIVLENFDGSGFEDSYEFEFDDRIDLLLSSDLDNDGIDEIAGCFRDSISIFSNIRKDSCLIENYLYTSFILDNYTARQFLFTDIDNDGDNDLFCTDVTRADVSWFENSFIDTLDYSKFPENDAVWTEQNAIYNGDTLQTWTSLYITESDTVLHGRSYVNIYEYYLNPGTFDTIRKLYASIRQNVLEKKVYIVRHYLSEENEKLLLDFNVDVGDTVILDAYYWDQDLISTDSVFILDSIGKAIIYTGEERDVQYLSNHKTPNQVSLSLIEGLGSVENPFGLAFDLGNERRVESNEFCCPEYLICLDVNNELVYVQFDEYRCNDLEVWTLTDPEVQKQFIKVYPNPTRDKINIEFFEKPVSDYEIVLYNNHGRMLEQHYYKQNQPLENIDFSEYKSGIYLLRIIYEDNSNTFRIVKVE